MALKPGDKAPAFTLFNTDKKKVSLSDFEGKQNVLLLFFPLAFTSVCTTELCEVRDNINKYLNENTVVLGISVDSPYALARYRKDESYNFPLLSDFNKAASKIYGALYESFGNMELSGVSKRSAFIIDKAGIVRYAEVLENPGLLPDFHQVDRVLAELEQVAPAGY